MLVLVRDMHDSTAIHTVGGALRVAPKSNKFCVFALGFARHSWGKRAAPEILVRTT